MAMDAATKDWLKSEYGFSDEEIAEKFTGERETKITRFHADARGLVSKQAEIDKAAADFKAANDKLNAEMAEWATLSVAEQSRAKQQAADLETARTRAFQLEQRLTTLATEHGVDPKSLIDGATPLPPKKEEPVVPAFDASKYVDRDQLGVVTGYMLTLPADLQYIDREHFALTGEHLDTRQIVAEVKARAGKQGADVDPIKIWESKYDIPAKREAKAKAEYDTAIKAAEASGYDRARTEQALPAAMAPGRHAPVFGTRTGDTMTPRTSVLKRPQPEVGVRSAAAALASGKYRQAAGR